MPKSIITIGESVTKAKPLLYAGDANSVFTCVCSRLVVEMPTLCKVIWLLAHLDERKAFIYISLYFS